LGAVSGPSIHRLLPESSDPIMSKKLQKGNEMKGLELDDLAGSVAFA
jgi:hypothetical protein